MPNFVSERLRKRSEFLTIGKAGERYVAPAFIVQVYRRAPEGLIRYGITASRKVGSAVDRNRAKRRLRALFNKIAPLLGRPGTDYVLIARIEVLKRDFTLMEQELSRALTKLHERG